MIGLAQKKRKEVHVTFEYFDKSDLTAILGVLKDKLTEGIETHHSDIKVREIADKWQKLQFQQLYVDTQPEIIEKEINGNLNFVIKSRM